MKQLSKKYPPPRESVSHRLVPIYSIRLLLVVTDDVEGSRLTRNALYGTPVNDHGYVGLCAWDEGFRVGLFFDRAELCHALIGHEIFHAAHRILEGQNVLFGVHNHEPFAHLTGWLTGHVYRELGRLGEKVNPEFSSRKYKHGEPRLTGPYLDE